MPQHPDLLETLRDAQRFGFFGSRPIEQAIQHTHWFVSALEGRPLASVIDLGSGGGLPGLVLADVYRRTSVVLVDRRQKRTDFLQRASLRLGFDHVSVIADEVERVCVRVENGVLAPFAAATARGFGPPDVTLRYARRLVASDGVIVISEPPTGNRWDDSLLEELRLTSDTVGQVRVFRCFT